MPLKHCQKEPTITDTSNSVFLIWFMGKVLIDLMCIYDKHHMSALQIKNEVKVILTVIKPRKNSEVPTGFKPMTSAIPVQCSITN